MYFIAQNMKFLKRHKGIANISNHLRFYEVQQKSAEWDSVIGLEVHAQISSESKLFSGASTAFGLPINSCVSLFDCATPGTLPVLNKRCVEAGVLAALALSCQINKVSLFDRKHYFYADLPAGYQITQQRQPLAVNGEFKFRVFAPGTKRPYLKTSRIKQIQLEQDSGKSLHDDTVKMSYLDLNRAGVPLIEFVFEPDLSDGEEAAALVKDLLLTLQRLDACSGKMEEGALRVDANVSVKRCGQKLGVRTEIKNIGSIRGVASAIKCEIHRQIKLLENGEKVINETLTWDIESKKLVPMRDKEEKQDYRFMPEPNLPPLHLRVNEHEKNVENLVDVDRLRSKIPELPEETRQKLETNFALTAQAAMILVSDDVLLKLFDGVMRDDPKRNSRTLANILINEFLTALNIKRVKIEACRITSRQVGNLLDLYEKKSINRNTVQDVLEELTEQPERMPSEIVESKRWYIISDDATLRKLCQDVIEENEKAVRDYKRGKTKVINYLLRKIANATNQRGDMPKLAKMLEEMLK